MSAGASSQTPLGNLQCYPRFPSWFQGATSRQEGNGGEGREGLGGVREEGKGGGKGRVGGIAPWLLGG